jgi:hypothetical protein
MTERDTDFEFDFFDEPETQEPATRQRPRRPGPRRPVRPPTGITPLLRLVGLIAFAILIVVLLVFWVQSCRSSSTKSAYRHYIEKVSVIARDSRQNGRELNTVLTTPGVKEADVERKVLGLARQEQLNVDRARDLDPPGRLIDEHQHLVEALQFRVSGLTGLAGSFRETATVKNTTNAATLLAEQMDRLLASDVIWDDRFKDPAKDELRRQDVGGVSVPGSHFLEDPVLASQSALVSVLERIRGASTGVRAGGLHGTNLVSVKVLPSGKELSTGTQTTVIATDKLAFEVAIKDSGGSQEVRIPVTLTIQQPSPITKTETLDLINPGETKSVVFSNLGTVEFTRPVTIKVDVKPVAGEHNTSNNSAAYPVIFSLPG